MSEEIKEILWDCEKQLNEASGYNDTTNKILDYIERLESQLQQKEKSINKAIKKLNKYRNRKDTWGLWCMEYGDNAEIIKILGGEVK